ncbi:GTPase Era [Candidatus Odyssella acanthamoebae]|uniref:GTPase Era n=1 Tax=Candidatus Odyssella acanthamoebae TaxID=91604 RepID=A0A077AWN9_9PROT|nr:GTPase Era [Candidatus Paracaedibacter acanthamoebae]AIK96053.1 GTPase Era [Candidatus Paracaedibacter acanthamoebae]
MTQFGFIAVLGEPNAGKSTLINQLVGQKVSIVSPKVQTTRQRILGIAMAGDAQLVLIDTPGIFAPKKRLDRAMVASAWDAGRDADQTILIVDASQKIQSRSQEILKGLEGCKVILVLNKVDAVDKARLLKLAETYHQYEQVTEIFMISALTGDGVPDLMAYLVSKAPAGPWMFPEDDITDMPQRLWASEITREQLYHQLHQELPYETFVETEAWEEFDNGSVKINQVIYVNRDGQKSIILGKRGAKIKEISQAAREELSQLLGRQVHLYLYVKVAENWSEKSSFYRNIGLDFNA